MRPQASVTRHKKPGIPRKRDRADHPPRLAELNHEKDSTLVLVHLPVSSDVTGTQSEPWRQFLRAQALSHDWSLIDVIGEFRGYPPQEVRSLFRGHYTEKGNAYVAHLLYERLLSIPGISRKLEPDTSGRSGPN